MKTSQRLKAIKAWLEKELCEGRKMKAPAPDMDITQIVRQTPRCYIGFTPTRPDSTGLLCVDPVNICPGIQIMPKTSYAKYIEQKRFDVYNKVYRPNSMGQSLAVDLLFSVYEPGIRLPGFVESNDSPDGLAMELLIEGTEEGVCTLTDWMDECVYKLLGVQIIPGCDLTINEESVTYGMYNDSHYIVDKRPIYYGFVSFEMTGFAQSACSEIEEMLK